MKAPITACLVCLLSACAVSQPDHFYVLSAQPQAAGAARTPPAVRVTLRVTLPSLVDRSEMVLNTSPDGVIALEHERWAAPLTDLVTQTLAQDIETRRSDVLIAGPSVNHPGTAAIHVAVDIVEVTVRRGDRARIETRWRVFDVRTGKETVGGAAFSAPLGPGGYATVAHALSTCVGLLADRVAELLPGD